MTIDDLLKVDNQDFRKVVKFLAPWLENGFSSVTAEFTEHDGCSYYMQAIPVVRRGSLQMYEIEYSSWDASGVCIDVSSITDVIYNIAEFVDSRKGAEITVYLDESGIYREMVTSPSWMRKD